MRRSFIDKNKNIKSPSYLNFLFDGRILEVLELNQK